MRSSPPFRLSFTPFRAHHVTLQYRAPISRWSDSPVFRRLPAVRFHQLPDRSGCFHAYSGQAKYGIPGCRAVRPAQLFHFAYAARIYYSSASRIIIIADSGHCRARLISRFASGLLMLILHCAAPLRCLICRQVVIVIAINAFGYRPYGNRSSGSAHNAITFI